MPKPAALAAALLATVSIACLGPAKRHTETMEETHWVGTWGAAPQLTEPGNLPPPPGLSDNTLRQLVYVSIGGSRLRLRISNAYGAAPLEIRSARIATPRENGEIDAETSRALAFAGAAAVTIPARGEAVSDALDYALAPLGKLAVSLAFGAVPSDVTGHPGSRTTSYLAAGDGSAAARLENPASTDHWYFLTSIEVLAPTSSVAVVTLGDSITDGRGSTTNGNDRWPDHLSRRLRASAATQGVAVVNQGIGGNAVLGGGLGPPAVERFDRDVLGQSGARHLIVFEGVNDIGGSNDPNVAARLIAAYERFIGAARAAGLRVYGMPILPLAGSIYDGAPREAARQAVNHWIRTSGAFDAVIDVDAALRDPANPAQLRPEYDSGDHLHPSPAGHKAIADTVDLGLFTR